VPRVLKDSGNVDVVLESAMTDNILYQKHKHESGKTYDIPEILKAHVKARLEIPKGKVLAIVCYKKLSEDKAKKGAAVERNAVEDIMKNRSGENVVESVIILIKPTIIKAQAVKEKAIGAIEDF
jgi:protoporphyrinogen oxidase